MPFTEICIYQVKPQKTEEFEALLSEAKSLLEKQEGLLMLRLCQVMLFCGIILGKGCEGGSLHLFEKVVG